MKSPRRPHLHALRALALAAFALLSAPGCGARVPRPATFSEDPAHLHAALARRREAVQSLSGELSLEVWEGDKRVRARQLFVASHPGRFRMDTLSPMEQPLSSLVCDGDLLLMHQMDAGRCFLGEANSKNLSRLSRLPLDPHAMAAALSGQPPLISDAGGQVGWSEERGLYTLTLDAPGARLADKQVVFIHPTHLLPVEVVLYRGARVEVVLHLPDYTTEEPRLPQRIRFELPNELIRVDARLKDYALNPDLLPETFSVEPPPGVTPEQL